MSYKNSLGTSIVIGEQRVIIKEITKIDYKDTILTLRAIENNGGKAVLRAWVEAYYKVELVNETPYLYECY